MTTTQVKTTTIIRGSLKPDLKVTIADGAAEADFSVLTTGMVTVKVERGNTIVDSGHPSTVVAAPDHKSAVVTRAWLPESTVEVGRLWVSVEVDWPGTKPQTFPDDGPLRLDVVRAAGDA